MQKFEFLRQPLLGELAMSRKKERREKREEKKMPFIVATYVYASSLGRRTHSARTNTFMPAAKGSALTLLGPTVNSSYSNNDFKYLIGRIQINQ